MYNVSFGEPVYGTFPAYAKMPQQEGAKDKAKLEAMAKRFIQRHALIGAEADSIIHELKNVLAVKELYGPRLWDTPGVAAMQIGVSPSGRPLLDVVVEQPGDAVKIPTFLMGPGPLGKLVRVRTRAIGYRLNLPKQRLRDAYAKLDQILFNLQDYRSAGITYQGDKRVGLAAVLLDPKYAQYLPATIMDFPIYVFYLS
jgi:hypothetical protein